MKGTETVSRRACVSFSVKKVAITSNSENIRYVSSLEVTQQRKLVTESMLLIRRAHLLIRSQFPYNSCFIQPAYWSYSHQILNNPQCTNPWPYLWQYRISCLVIWQWTIKKLVYITLVDLNLRICNLKMHARLTVWLENRLHNFLRGWFIPVVPNLWVKKGLKVA